MRKNLGLRSLAPRLARVLSFGFKMKRAVNDDNLGVITVGERIMWRSSVSDMLLKKRNTPHAPAVRQSLLYKP